MGLLSQAGMIFVGLSTIAVGGNLLRTKTEWSKRIVLIVMLLNLGIIGFVVI